MKPVYECPVCASLVKDTYCKECGTPIEAKANVTFEPSFLDALRRYWMTTGEKNGLGLFFASPRSKTGDRQRKRFTDWALISAPDAVGICSDCQKKVMG